MPAATIVTVLPAAVSRVPPVVLLKVTARVELAVALTAYGAIPRKSCPTSEQLLIVCDFLTIVLSLSVALLLARLASTTSARKLVSDAVLSNMPVAAERAARHFYSEDRGATVQQVDCRADIAASACRAVGARRSRIQVPVTLRSERRGTLPTTATAGHAARAVVRDGNGVRSRPTR